jgi:hypothetical protein
LLLPKREVDYNLLAKKRKQLVRKETRNLNEYKFLVFLRKTTIMRKQPLVIIYHQRWYNCRIGGISIGKNGHGSCSGFRIHGNQRQEASE